MPATASPRWPWPLVAVLALGAFTTATNTTVLSPLLGPISAEFAAPTAVAGQLATTIALVAGATALLAAPWLDRVSRGFWLRVESALLIAGTRLSALAPSFGWLFAVRSRAAGAGYPRRPRNGGLAAPGRIQGSEARSGCMEGIRWSR